MRTVVICLPDPADLAWEQRVRLRSAAADAVREAIGTNETVGVDILPDEPIAMASAWPLTGSGEVKGVSGGILWS